MKMDLAYLLLSKLSKELQLTNKRTGSLEMAHIYFFAFLGSTKSKNTKNNHFHIKTLFSPLAMKKLLSKIDLWNKSYVVKKLILKPRKKVEFWKRNNKMSPGTNFQALFQAMTYSSQERFLKVFQGSSLAVKRNFNTLSISTTASLV